MIFPKMPSLSGALALFFFPHGYLLIPHLNLHKNKVDRQFLDDYVVGSILPIYTM